MRQGVLFFIIVSIIFCSTVWAAGGDMGGGDGSEGNPYLIADLDDFDVFAADPNYWASGVYTTLMTDIDLSGRTYTTAVIATDTDSSNSTFDGTKFAGTFDGNNHVIKNLTIEGNDLLGFIGYADSGASINNLGMEDVDISGGYSVGGLVAWNYYGSLTSCYVTGSVSATSNCVGGLVGGNVGGGTINSSYTNVSVSGGRDYVGGVVGYNTGNLIYCYGTGTVTGTRNCTGGLVGQNLLGSVDSCYASGVITGEDETGGLVGRNEGSVISCFSTGTVSGNQIIGGMIGYNANSSSAISCCSTGAVSGNIFVGGLVGIMGASSITDCYSTGLVEGTDYVGGLVGSYGLYNTVTACFWDIQTSNMSKGIGDQDPDPTGITGKMTSEMQTQSTFTNWDFVGEDTNGTNDIWRMCVDEVDYPRLSWEFAQNGDFACEDGVDIFDLQALAENWLLTEITNPTEFSYACDANGDGVIDMVDYSVLGENW